MNKLGTFEWAIETSDGLSRREPVELWTMRGRGNEVDGPEGPALCIVRKGGTIASDTILALDVSTARTFGLLFNAFARDGY